MLFSENILRNSDGFYFNIYEPNDYKVILGMSRTPEGDVYNEACKDDNVSLMKRISGGGTVLLAPGMFVWELIIPTKTQLLNQKIWFNVLSGWLLNNLSSAGVENAEVKGTSDITIDNRKICGASLYIGKNKILYHGTLLLDIDPHLFDKYLKFPDIVPDYRQGRIHSEFVTTLKQQNINVEREELNSIFKKNPFPTEENYHKLKLL
jgi:lipoate---protein ligase